MRLKTVEFYQSVRLWNNQERKTIDSISEGLDIDLVDHLVMLSNPEQEDVIVVPTANLRHGRMAKDPAFPEGFLPDLTELQGGTVKPVDNFEIGQSMDITEAVTGEKPSDETLGVVEIVKVDKKNKTITAKVSKKK